MIKFENDRKKCADTEVKTDLLCLWIYTLFTQKKVYQTNQIKYQEHISQNSFAFLNSLNANHSEHLSGNSYQEFERKWTKLVSRGYLIDVNDEMFEFTKQLKLVVTSVLNAKIICKYSGQDLRDIIVRKISDNELIMKAWNVL